MQLIAYLGFDGNCEEAFRYYEKHLGGKIEAMVRTADTPAAEHSPKDMQERIMHARLAVGEAVLMGGDGPPGRGGEKENFCVSIQIDDVAEAERIYNALADGGTVIMPLEETFWAERFGMATDRFGTPWMINCGMKS